MTKAQQTIIDRLNIEYAYQPCPIGADPFRHAQRERVRSVLGIAALELVQLAPPSRELNQALNKVEESRHWAFDAIDRYGPEASG